VGSSRRGSSPASLYSVHPGIAMMQQWIAKLPEKTGRSLEEWIALVRTSGPPTEEARSRWLMAKHKLGSNAARCIAGRAEGKGLEEADPEAYLRAAARYVEELYAGGKAGLRLIHDRLVEIGLALGKDVKICPGKTIVPLYRAHVFAQIKPATRTRIDLGLALGAVPASKLPAHLVDTGGLAKGDRITHRIGITSLEEIDAEVGRWLEAAYKRDA
jgi:uncharacterized protein DUF5655/uncharacterized protein DUF4287